MPRATKSHRFPVTVTKLPVVRCQLCRDTFAHRPGEASDVLTRHYEKKHLDDAAEATPKRS